MTDYDRDTKFAYRTGQRAAEYKKYNTTAWSWGRIATDREQRALHRVFTAQRWTSADRVLDIPCGTGILAGVLNTLDCRVVASDISAEMMREGRDEYRPDHLLGVIQADLTTTPFVSGSFAGVCMLGFLHRVPRPVKQAALREAARLSSAMVVVTCAMDTPAQRLKQRLIKLLRPGHVPAPCPSTLAALSDDWQSAGLRLREWFDILPFMSAERVFVLEKAGEARGDSRT